MNSEFDCPMEPGVQCKSLGEINRMVDQGKIGQSYHMNNTKKTQGCAWNGCNQAMTEFSDSGSDVMRVWVPPYSDETGNYHQSSMLYSALN